MMEPDEIEKKDINFLSKPIASKSQHLLPIPERPQTASGLSNNTQNKEDIVMADESLLDFKKKEPEVQVPPDSNKRTFNENDILGEFDRDEKGNVIVLQDENGEYVDKQGR